MELERGRPDHRGARVDEAVEPAIGGDPHDGREREADREEDLVEPAAAPEERQRDARGPEHERRDDERAERKENAARRGSRGATSAATAILAAARSQEDRQREDARRAVALDVLQVLGGEPEAEREHDGPAEPEGKTAVARSSANDVNPPRQARSETHPRRSVASTGNRLRRSGGAE